jgi:flagellar motor switch protein FliN
MGADKTESKGNPISKNLEALLEIELPVCVSFGRAQLPLAEVLRLGPGAVVELNRTADEPVELIVNDSVIARGKIVMIEGNYGLEIQEIASRQQRLKTADGGN